MKTKTKIICILIIFIFINYFSIYADAWEIETAQQVNNYLNIGGQETDPKLIFFRPDGAKLFMIGDISDRVHQYSLSIAWNINSAEYDGISYDFSSEVTDPKGIFFKPDGMKMFLNDCCTDRIYQYSLSEAWDITTLSYDGVSYHFFNEFTNPKSLYFKPDGSRLFIDCYVNDRVYQYDLSEPWDLSTISYNGESFYFRDITTQPQQVSFRPDGMVMFLNCDDNDSIYRFDLETAWDVTSAEYTGSSLEILYTVEDHLTRGHHFSPDGHSLYFVGCQHKRIYQLTLKNAWDIDIAYYNNYYNFRPDGNDMQSVLFNSDGSLMFMIEYSTNRVIQYSLAIPWDARSAEYNGLEFDFTNQEPNPRGMFISTDGSRMFINGSVSDAVHQYTLDTPWDVSTAYYENKSLDISSQEPGCRGIYMKPDGSKLYLAGATHRIYQYSLEENWDIESAVYNGISHYTGSQTSTERGLFIKPDGTILYMVGSGNDIIYQYEMSEPWELSSITYSGISLNVHCYEGDLRDLYISPAGEILYFMGSGADKLFQLFMCPIGTPVNFPPEITLPDSIIFNEDEVFEFDLSPYVYDSEGDSLTILSEGSEFLTVDINGFTAVITPAENWNGSQTLNFSVCDGLNRDISSDNIQVIVTPVNDPPVLSLPSELSSLEDIPFTVDFNQYVTEVDGDQLEINISGNLNINFDIIGMFVTFSTPENWFGSEVFEVSVSDGLLSDSGIVTIEFDSVNDIPWIDLPDSLVFYADALLTCDFSEYAGDVDDSEIELSAAGYEMIDIYIENLEVTFSCSENWLGCEYITFTVNDNHERDTASDSVLVMVYPTGKPEIISVEDRPEDQGGYVYLQFAPSYYDDVEVLGERSTEFYTVWYYENENWIALNSIGAIGGEQYIALVNTPADSISTNPALTEFRISAHFDEGTWISNTMTGYSVDNLSPSPPAGLMITGNQLIWTPISDNDLAFYCIYINGELFCTSELNVCNIEGLTGIITVTACDLHENESNSSESILCGCRYGDISNNGLVEAFDATLALQYFCSIEPYGFPLPWQSWRLLIADVDGNGVIEAYDSGLILMYVVEMIDQFPVETRK